MLRRAAAVLARRPALLPSAPALLVPLALPCLASQLAPRGLAKKAAKEKSGKAGKAKARSDEDDEDEDGAAAGSAGSAGEGPDLDKLAAQMERSVGLLLKEYHGMQVGRATLGMLDSVQVVTPGGSVPLASVGKALAQSARQLQVSVFDAANVAAVAKAIETSGLQLTPEIAGKTIKVSLPRPTAESREALRREVRRAAEVAKTALRAARQKAMKKAKAMPSKDDVKRAEKEVDKVTDGFSEKVDREVAKKEAEVMEV